MDRQRHFVLFDLDGTLVPLSRERFEPALFQNMSEMFHRHFPDASVVEAIKRAAFACFHDRDGLETNERRFTNALRESVGERAEEILAALEAHYKTDYNQISAIIRHPSIAEEALAVVAAHGGIPVLVTNPIHPASCINARLGWIGIAPERFQLVTSYERFHFTKPDPRFYLEVLELLQAKPTECLMIGNDTDEDIEAAMRAGIETYLVTDFVMDRRDSIEQYRHGSSREMLKFLQEYLTR